jgi:hypothetical protein
MGCLTAGTVNIAIGEDSACTFASGSRNVFLGYQAGKNLTAGCNNIAIGNLTEFASATGCCQLVIGFDAGANYWLAGDSTKAIKPGAGIIDCAGSCGTAGQVLMSNGSNAICWGTAGSSASPATPTTQGTLYGCSDANVVCNTALGYNALLAGGVVESVAVGSGALECSAFGSCNTAIGHHSQRVGDGTRNTSVGTYALCKASAEANVAIGCGAGCDLTAGRYNVIIGTDVQTSSATSECELAIGYNTGQHWLTGDSTLAIKPGAGIIDCANSCGTASQALMSNGANALCWGDVLTPSCLTAPGSLITASIPSFGAPLEVFELPGGTGGQILTYAQTKFGCNLAWCDPVGAATPGALGLVYGIGQGTTASVSVGQGSLNSLTTGGSNTALGVQSLNSLTEGNDNVAVGFCAGQCLTTQCNNVSIGSWSGGFSTYSNSVLVGTCAGYAGGTDSVVVGYAALASSTLGVDKSVIIGSCALNDNPYSGNQLVAIGPNVALPNFNDSCQLAIGFSATENWLTGNSTKAIKPGAGIIDCAGSCGTAGQVLMSNGSNAICWGTAGGGASPATPTTRGTVYACTTDSHPTSGTGDVSLGLDAYTSVTTGYSNTAIGGEALRSLTSGCNNVGIGDQAGAAITSQSNNTIIGANTGLNGGATSSTVIGAGIDGNLTNTENVIVGYSATSTIGSVAVECSVILGTCALTSTAQVGSNLIAIGHCIALPSSSGSTQLAIGNGSTYWLSGNSNYAIKPGAGIIDCAGSCGGTGQVLTSTGSNGLQWASPASPTVIYNRLVDVTASTAANVIGWAGERGGSTSYLQNGNTSAMLFITANSGSDGSTPAAWAQIMIASVGGAGLSQIIASNTSGGTWSIDGVLYPANSDTTIQFTSNTTQTPMLFNIVLTQFGGFREPVIVYGTAAT